MRENYALRKERDDHKQNEDRWRNLALAFWRLNECQAELMDEMNRLLFRDEDE